MNWSKVGVAVAIVSIITVAFVCSPGSAGEETSALSQQQRVSGEKVRLMVKETVLAKAPTGIVWESVVLSPDCRRVAYAAKQDDKWLVVADNPSGVLYDGFQQVVSSLFSYWHEGTMAFSPDSKRVVYAARRGDKWVVVVDGVQVGQHEDFKPGSVRFSPDGRRVTYVAKRGQKWAVQDTSTTGTNEYEQVGCVVFSPDGKHLAYEAKRGNDWFVVIDGKMGKKYESTSGLCFSPDGKRTAYTARRGEKWLAVVDGVEGNPYESFSSFALYSSGIGRSQSSASGGSLVFSPDSKHVAYTASRANQWFIVLDGVESAPYEEVGAIKQSPDGRKLAFGARRNNKGFPVVNGEAGKAYDYFVKDSVVLSPNGERVLFIAARGGEGPFFVGVDRVEGRDYEGLPMAAPSSAPTVRDSLT